MRRHFTVAFNFNCHQQPHLCFQPICIQSYKCYLWHSWILFLASDKNKRFPRHRGPQTPRQCRPICNMTKQRNTNNRVISQKKNKKERRLCSGAENELKIVSGQHLREKIACVSVTPCKSAHWFCSIAGILSKGGFEFIIFLPSAPFRANDFCHADLNAVDTQR